MLKYTVLLMTLFLTAYAGIVTQKVVSVKEDKATINIDTADVGMSGFVVRHIDAEHSAIIASIQVSAFDKDTKTATLTLGEYTALKQDYLPQGKWQVKAGDEAVLASGYSRALLIAPDEDVYYRITKALPSLEWLHPDIFATLLSSNGHPTPLKEDFEEMCSITATGLLYIYVHQNLFTLDCKSMTILQITPAPLKEENVKLPFYSRIEKINANWFGKGSSRLKAYDPYYYEFLAKNNKTNKALYNIVKEQNQTDILDEFEIKDTK